MDYNTAVTQFSCPICETRCDTRYLNASDPLTSHNFSVHGCAKCHHGYTKPVPEDLGRYYGDRYYGNRHSLTSRWCSWRRMRVVSQSVQANSPGKILDIGCGDGSFLIAARARGWDVYGTELNLDGLRDPKIAVVSTIGDAQQFAPFDCITLWHSLEHFLDPRQALLDLHPLLAPNGTLLIAVPNAYGSQARLFGTNWLALDVPRHLHHFSSQSLQLLLTQTGFQPSRLWHHEAEYDVFGWMQSVLNKVHHKPNVLFDLLTGRKLQLSPLARTTQLLAGALLFTPAFILTVITTWLKVGGTLLQSSKPVR